jgi:hypothetical protein
MLQFILWKDIFVVVDKGRAAASDYQGGEKLLLQQAARYPNGIGMLTVVPPDAVPPSADARAAIGLTLKRLGTGLRCASWLVEGSGFQGAMVRAVLLGLKIFGRNAYPTYVSTDLADALVWMVKELKGEGLARSGDVPAAARFIRAQREPPSITASP